MFRLIGDPKLCTYIQGIFPASILCMKEMSCHWTPATLIQIQIYSDSLFLDWKTTPLQEHSLLTLHPSLQLVGWRIKVTSPKYTACHTRLSRVPLWPPHHTGCIIKWVPAGVWCPGDRGENKACWREETPLPPSLPPFFLQTPSSPPPPPSNSLSMPSHDERAVRASLLDVTHRGETLTAAQGAAQQTGRALPTRRRGWKPT